MVAIGQLSVKKGLWSRSEALRQSNLLQKAGLPVNWPILDHNSVIRSLQGDKKVRAGKLTFILPSAIGKVTISSDIEINEIKDLLNILDKY